MPDDDSSLFRQLVGDVEPLRSDSTVPVRPRNTETPGMRRRRRAAEVEAGQVVNELAAADMIERVKPWDELSFKRDGVQHGVFKNLRQGKYTCDVHLDLHRQTVDEARVAIRQLVDDCLRHNIRCALITHGKGENREQPALLKSCVNHWLRQLDEVLAFHSAQRHHGGFGATYVLLRKSSEKREENKERFSRRKL